MLYLSRMAEFAPLVRQTMACGYWKAGKCNDQAVFHLVMRELPFSGGYAVCAGLAQAVSLLDDLDRGERLEP